MVAEEGKGKDRKFKRTYESIRAGSAESIRVFVPSELGGLRTHRKTDSQDVRERLHKCIAEYKPSP